jgi:hypothetical protein
MKFIYLENEKRHIFESETGHVSTFLKERVTKEQAEALFLAQLANAGITAPEEAPVTEPEVATEPTLPTEPETPVETPTEPAPVAETPSENA